MLRKACLNLTFMVYNRVIWIFQAFFCEICIFRKVIRWTVYFGISVNSTSKWWIWNFLLNVFFFFFCRMLRLQETKRIVGLSTSRSTNRPALSTLALSPFSMQGLSLTITFAVWRQNSDWLRDDLKPGSSKCTWSKSWSTFPEIQPVDSAPSQVQTCSQPFPVLFWGFFNFWCNSLTHWWQLLQNIKLNKSLNSKFRLIQPTNKFLPNYSVV